MYFQVQFLFVRENVKSEGLQNIIDSLENSYKQTYVHEQPDASEQTDMRGTIMQTLVNLLSTSKPQNTSLFQDPDEILCLHTGKVLKEITHQLDRYRPQEQFTLG